MNSLAPARVFARGAGRKRCRTYFPAQPGRDLFPAGIQAVGLLLITTGKTLCSYAAETRMKKAIPLLGNRQLKIKQAAYKAGTDPGLHS